MSRRGDVLHRTYARRVRREAYENAAAAAVLANAKSVGVERQAETTTEEEDAAPPMMMMD